MKQQGDGAGETSRTTNYELQGTGWATRAPVAQTLQSVRQTCPRTIATCSYVFVRFPSFGIFTPTRTSPVNNELKKLEICGQLLVPYYQFLEGGYNKFMDLCAPFAQTLQSVRQTCPCTTATSCPYMFVRFPSCGIFTPTRTSPVKQPVETTV